MGITIVQKSDLKKDHKKQKQALIRAGGAVTGGSFMAGGLKALNDYMTNFTVSEFDVFVGISSGSLLAAPLVGGITPEEMLKSLDGTSDRFSELSPWYYYWPNLKELVARPVAFWLRQLMNLPGLTYSFLASTPMIAMRMGKLFKALMASPTSQNYEALMSAVTDIVSEISLPSLLQLLPSGIFDNSSIEKYLKHNIKKNHLTNNFQAAHKATGKSLYISAMAVDGAKRVVFGHDENNSATISQAVQASTAMPGFYKPARINGVDYVDGGVQETASIDIAIKKGAHLIVCYNPFRPYDNKILLEYIRKENKYVSSDRRLSDDGVMAIINQIFRAMFHSRLHVVLDQYRADPTFKGDIILIEPKADDAAFFGLNPLIFGNRIKAAVLGYKSVRNSIDEMYPQIAKTLAAYGIEMDRAKVEKEMTNIKVAGDTSSVLRHVIEDNAVPRPIKKKKVSKLKKCNSRHSHSKRSSKRSPTRM